jgi:predicted Zn-dependent peptidase
MDNITPRKCLIVGSGVKNHREFVDLVKERLGELLPVPEHLYQRTSSEYIGGEYRTWTETPQTNILLAFQSSPWRHEDTAALHVMNTLIGNSEQSLRNRAHNRVRTTNYVDSVSSINNHFSDSGLFGISVTGAGSHSQELLQVALEELSNLRNNVGDQELARAKNVTKMNVLLTIENQTNRLEEIANNYLTFGDLTFHQYAE